MTDPHPPAPLLAFDTAGPHLAAALVQGGTLRVTRMVTMEKGQAEALLPFLVTVLDEAGLRWSDLGALAVGVGPGNFTGVRIAVSAARGLALGLGIPAYSISAFDLMRAPDDLNQAGCVWLSLPGPRDQVLVQSFFDGRPTAPPRLIDPAHPPGDLPRPDIVRGHQAGALAWALGARAEPALVTDLPQRLTALALWRQAQGLPDGPPRPVYVRPPDAAPPAQGAPVLIG